MKNLNAGITTFFLFCASINLWSQNNVESHLNEMVEQLYMDEEEERNWENEIEALSEKINEPLNLNTITKEQLEQFPFLNDIQIENILAYIYIHGQMQTIYELQMVEEMDRQTIHYLSPFVYVKPILQQEPIPAIKNILKYGKNEVLTRLDIPFYKRKGYETSYLGPAVYHSFRYAFRYKDQIYAGVTAEKDAGEPFLTLHNKKGYDYYSFYFYIRSIRKLKTLAIGNYRLSFGQGLVVSNDFVMGKTASISTMTLRNNTIKKHSSTDEYNYFRGLATAVQLNDFIVSGFYSHRSLDGITTENSISSIQKTGLHRTQKEADRRGVFTMQLAGGNISYNHKTLKVGMTGIYYFFDRPYEPQIREYSKYNIRGNHFYNLGVDYKYRWNRIVFLGETAVGKNRGIATLNSITYALKSHSRLTLLYRFYDHDYWGMFARSFSEGGYVQNENGFYMAAETALVRRWKFFLSADFFAFPWLKYGIDKPSTGYDFIIQSTYTPHENLSMLVRYRFKNKEKNYTNEEKIKSVRPLYHHKIRYQLTYTPWKNINLRSTVDYNQINPQGVPASRGFQFIQTAAYTFSGLPLRIELHGAYFHTDDYSSRVFSYEKSLLYTFYIPSFYGRGIRTSMFLRYDITKNWMCIVKFGSTIYHDRQEIGSGLDLIRGNKKSDLQMQLRITF